MGHDLQSSIFFSSEMTYSFDPVRSPDLQPAETVILASPLPLRKSTAANAQTVVETLYGCSSRTPAGPSPRSAFWRRLKPSSLAEAGSLEPCLTELSVAAKDAAPYCILTVFMQ